MRCKFRTSDGLCADKYKGFGCIGRQCSHYRDSLKCEHHEETGDYCRKYARFGCVGKDSCETLADYLTAVAEEA